MMKPILLTSILVFGLISLSRTQTIQNVTRLSTTQFSPVSGEDFVVADVWGFTDEGREYAVLARTEAGVSIIDVTNPTHPVIAGFVPIAAGGHNLFHAKYYNGYIYTVMRPGPLQIIDARDPYNPTIVKEYSTGFNEAYVIFICDSVAYLADVESSREGVSLIALDISDPVNPVELGTWYRTYHHIFVRNDTLIGFVQKGEVDFLDVSDPSNIQNIYTVENTGSKTHSGWLHDRGELLTIDHELIGGHLALWDVNPLNYSSMLSEYSTATNNVGETSLHHSRWYFDLIYMSYWEDCFRVVDASDPLNLQEVAVYDTIQPNPDALYRGMWGCYPYLPSRNVLVSDPKVGLIVLDYVNDGPGVSRQEIDTTYFYGNIFRGQFSQLNGNPIDTSASYVFYRFSTQNTWQKSKVRTLGVPDSFFFEITLNSQASYLDYYLQLKDNQSQKTRVPGLAPSLDFIRTKIISVGTTIPEIYLSEISDGANAQNAFIEIYNASGQDIDLTLAKIVRCSSGSDNQFNVAYFVFDLDQDEISSPYSTMVPAYGFLIIANGSDRATFESEWGPLPANANFNPGNSNLQIGQGSGTRWVLLVGGNANAFDGTIIDRTPSNIGGENQYARQQTVGNWVVSSNSSDATPGTLANDQSLPVNLITFKAHYTGSGIQLTWETASEFNNLGFQILKRVANHSYALLANYENAPSLKSKGNGALGFRYTFEDTEIITGQHYSYVLQSVSYSGHTVSLDTLTIFTNERMVITNTPIQISSYPNPFNSQTEIFIQLNKEIKTSPQIQIFNLNGRVIKQFKAEPSYSYHLKWDGKDEFSKILPSGIYFLRVKSGLLEHTKKLLLVR